MSGEVAYASASGLAGSDLLAYLTRRLDEVDYPFLTELTPRAVSGKVWAAQLQALDCMAGVVFGRADLFTWEELSAAWAASPASWLVCRAASDPDALLGYAHVQPLSGAAGDRLRFGWERHRGSDAGTERGFADDGYGTAGPGDFIHCGAVVRRAAGNAFDDSTLARLVGGIVDRVQQITAGGGPHRVVAVSHPEYAGDRRAQPREHGKKLLRAFGFTSTAGAAEGGRPMRDACGRDVYVLDVERNRSALLEQIGGVVAQKRARYFRAAPHAGVSLTVGDRRVRLADACKGYGIELEPPGRVYAVLRLLAETAGQSMAASDLEVRLEECGALSVPEPTRLGERVDAGKPFRQAISLTRSFLRDAFGALGLSPPEYPVAQSGRGADASFRLVLTPSDRR